MNRILLLRMWKHTFESLLRYQVGNGVAAGTAALETDMAALQGEIDGMQEKLTATLERFDDAKQDCEAIESEVVDEVRSVVATESFICEDRGSAWDTPRYAECVIVARILIRLRPTDDEVALHFVECGDWRLAFAAREQLHCMSAVQLCMCGNLSFRSLR